MLRDARRGGLDELAASGVDATRGASRGPRRRVGLVRRRSSAAAASASAGASGFFGDGGGPPPSSASGGAGPTAPAVRPARPDSEASEASDASEASEASDASEGAQGASREEAPSRWAPAADPCPNPASQKRRRDRILSSARSPPPRPCRPRRRPSRRAPGQTRPIVASGWPTWRRARCCGRADRGSDRCQPEVLSSIVFCKAGWASSSNVGPAEPSLT